MASAAELARRYFEALSAHDLDAALAHWAPGGIERIVGQQELTAPHGVRAYFTEMFEAFPDFKFQVLELTSGRGRVAVRWAASGTFAGPGFFQGFAPNGARMVMEGCDVVTVADERIERIEVYIDSGAVARELGFLPPAGSTAEARLTKLANVRTRLAQLRFAAEPETIADGVWVVRGGRPRTMNVYLIADDGAVTVFDAGVADMGVALRTITARMGGIKRVVLGHADADHRGAAPALDAPVMCHEAERVAAGSESSLRPYWDLAKLARPVGKLYPALLRHWDGGPVQIAGTLAEGDEVAGFRVVELPGHAPGLIGLFRESDRLALVSDCFYTIDPQTGRKNAAHIPHPAFNQDSDQARRSIRKLAALDPSAAWAGHAEPVLGDVARQLEAAASAPA